MCLSLFQRFVVLRQLSLMEIWSKLKTAVRPALPPELVLHGFEKGTPIPAFSRYWLNASHFLWEGIWG